MAERTLSSGGTNQLCEGRVMEKERDSLLGAIAYRDSSLEEEMGTESDIVVHNVQRNVEQTAVVAIVGQAIAKSR